MQSKLYVGNLSYQVTQEEVSSHFAKYGTVQSVNLINDRSTGQSKGFGFVEMSSAEEAQKALELNGTEFLGRKIIVSEARPQEPRSGGGREGGDHRSRGGRGGGGGGRGRGFGNY